MIGKFGRAYASLALAAALLVPLPAFADPKAVDEFMIGSAGKIGYFDFVVKIGKTDISLLYDGTEACISASGKALSKMGEGASPLEEYCLPAKEALFYIQKGKSYADAVELTKKGQTARGVKIGSAESELLLYYPKPTRTLSTGYHDIYFFSAPNEEALLSSSVNGSRPLWHYDIVFEVNSRTKKVDDIYFIHPEDQN